MGRAVSAVFVLACLPSSAESAGRYDAITCLSPGDTLEIVTEHKVLAPSAAILLARKAAPGAEVLRAALCHDRGNALFFFVTMLRRDGRIMRVTVDGLNGKLTILP